MNWSAVGFLQNCQEVGRWRLRKSLDVSALGVRKGQEPLPPCLASATGVAGLADGGVGRIESVNAWYAGTWLEQALSAFLIMNLLGLGLLALRSLSLRTLDKPFAVAWGGMLLGSLVFSLSARTVAWQSVANWLLG